MPPLLFTRIFSKTSLPLADLITKVYARDVIRRTLPTISLE
jgi:hypothetical protein